MRAWAAPLGVLLCALELSTGGLPTALWEASDANDFVLSDPGRAQSLVCPVWRFLHDGSVLSQKSMLSCPS